MRGPIPTLVLLFLAVPTGCGVDVEAREQHLEHQLRWRQEPATEVHIYRSSEPEEDAVYDYFNGITPGTCEVLDAH